MTDGDPKRVAIPVWSAMRQLNAVMTDAHDLDGDFPDVTASEIHERLEAAGRNIDDAIEAVDRVAAANADQDGDQDD